MQSLPVSQFKAECLSRLKQVRDSGESLEITLHGESLAMIQAPAAAGAKGRETVAATFARLRPLLLAGGVDDPEPELEPELETRRRWRGSGDPSH